MYMPARAVTSLAAGPSCLEMTVQQDRLVEVVVREPNGQIALTRSDAEGVEWNATRALSPQRCRQQSPAQNVAELRRRCGRLWPLRRPPIDARVEDDALGRTHAVFALPGEDGGVALHYARCGEASEHQVLAVLERLGPLALAVDATSEPHVVFAGGVPSELTYVHHPDGLLERTEVFDPALQLGLQACVARFERPPCRLSDDAAACSRRAAEDELYCDWLVEHLDDDELRARRFIRNQTPTSCTEDATRASCLVGQSLIFEHGLMLDVGWSFVLGRDQAPRYAFETLFGHEVFEAEPGCFPGLDSACIQSSMVRLSTLGGEATMAKLYQRSDGTVVEPLRDEWQTTQGLCARGEDERACTAVAIGWERGVRTKPDEGPIGTLSVLKSGCEAGVGRACLQAWWVEREKARTPAVTLPPAFDALLERGCTLGIDDACASLEALEAIRDKRR